MRFSIHSFLKALVVVNILMHGFLMTYASINGGDAARYETLLYIFVAAAAVIWTRDRSP